MPAQELLPGCLPIPFRRRLNAGCVPECQRSCCVQDRGPDWTSHSGYADRPNPGFPVPFEPPETRFLLMCEVVQGRSGLRYQVCGMHNRISVIPAPLMLTDQIIALLIAERDRLNRAIEALQGTKRRGRRPQNSFAATAAPAPVKKRRSTFTAAQRKAQGEKMKAYWAKRKAAEKL